MDLPSAIIFTNGGVTLSRINYLHTQVNPTPSTVQGLDVQLQITEVISLEEFGARINSNPNYPQVVHLQQQRILVIVPDFQDKSYRRYADVVMFVKQGTIGVLQCKYREPGYTISAQNINIFNLLYGIDHAGNSPCCPYPSASCPPGFPPPICPPQHQSFENPRPPERPCFPMPWGMGALELYGATALELHQRREDSVFGGYHKDHCGCNYGRNYDCDCHCECGCQSKVEVFIPGGLHRDHPDCKCGCKYER
jgi:hypothetical protein